MSTYRSLKYHDELLRWFTYANITISIAFYVFTKLTARPEQSNIIATIAATGLVVRALIEIIWAVWFWRASANLRNYFSRPGPFPALAVCFLGFDLMKCLVVGRALAEYTFGWALAPITQMIFYPGLILLYANVLITPILLWWIHSFSAALVNRGEPKPKRIGGYSLVYGFFNLIAFSLRESGFAAEAVLLGVAASLTIRLIVHDVRRWQGAASGVSSDVHAPAPPLAKHSAKVVWLFLLGMASVVAFSMTLDYLNVRERLQQNSN